MATVAGDDGKQAAAAAASAGAEEEEASGAPDARTRALPSCDICGGAGGKYRCPACERRTCCLACVNEHKKKYGCTGKRPRADYVAPLKAFDDRVVTRDFGFLEEVDTAIDGANRAFRRQGFDLRVHQGRRHSQRSGIARACAAPERRTRLILAPSALDLARRNTSKLVEPGGSTRKGKAKGKGKGKSKGKSKGKGDGLGERPSHIAWRVEWHFGPTLLEDRALPEFEVVGPSLARFLENTWSGGMTKHRLLPYAEAGLDALEVFLEQPPRISLNESLAESDDDEEVDDEDDEEEEEEESREEESDEEGGAKRSAEGRGRAAKRKARWRQLQQAPAAPYCKLDKSKSFRENLAGRAIVEFPVLHVALPSEVSRFPTSA
eukprot:TRINITY_DN3552_c0_g1_i1.p1 TRINITY_DN3552_c0_g1~~TRINITY_DN3552_c0_g1_i1.p1  ORF type:complete len:392 (-),score=116.52 TRINITY_DN3552_c0_g1_i1:44-1177(-)